MKAKTKKALQSAIERAKTLSLKELCAEYNKSCNGIESSFGENLLFWKAYNKELYKLTTR